MAAVRDMKLNRDVLVAIGVPAISDQGMDQLLRMCFEVMQLVAGMRLATNMEPQELAQLDSVALRGNAAALAWLETTAPDYHDTVRAVYVEVLRTVGLASQSIPAELRSMFD